MPSTPSLRLHLKRPAENAARAGHPWIFAESIHAQNRSGKTGECALLFDRHDRFLGFGLFDGDSPIRVRLLHVGKPAKMDEGWWSRHLMEPLDRREKLFDERTTGYRFLHGENDRWPGLVLDRYGSTLALKLYTAAWFPHLRLITSLINSGIPNDRMVLRLSRNIGETAAAEGWSDGQILHGSAPARPVPFLENGLQFESDVLRGQKTGFFLDQRENRARVESLAAGRRVLNAFSYSGGFSLYAGRGGAASVLSVDMSRDALAAAERHFQLNRAIGAVARCRHETLQADVFDWLPTARTKEFDLIILDPPSLAKREKQRAEAIRTYARLASDAMGRLKRGGILVAASCSAHVSAAEFFQATLDSASRSRRRFTELNRTFHPPDHPATFPEAEYLKCLYLRFD